MVLNAGVQNNILVSISGAMGRNVGFVIVLHTRKWS